MEDEKPAWLPGMPIFGDPLDFFASKPANLPRHCTQKLSTRNEKMSTQLFISETEPCTERLEPITEHSFHPTKPHGGIWTSTWQEEAQTSGWVEWCRCEGFGHPDGLKWWLLTPHKQLRIYTIDRLRDLTALARGYSLPHDYMFRLDYSRLAQDYDAIHLTEEGQDATRLTYPVNLYGWDCESTIWFRWCFSEVKAIEQAKRRA